MSNIVQYIDGFSNWISNIPSVAEPNSPWQIRLKTSLESYCLSGIKKYSNLPIGNLVALIGSHGRIEIACNGGSAAAAIAAFDGTLVGTPIEMAGRVEVRKFQCICGECFSGL